jgi:hypothetical protein
LIEKKGMLKKEGNRLVFTTSEGEIIKQFRKAWEKQTMMVAWTKS